MIRVYWKNSGHSSGKLAAYTFLSVLHKCPGFFTKHIQIPKRYLSYYPFGLILPNKISGPKTLRFSL